MRPLTELLDIDDPAWPEIAAAIAAAPYPVVVLDADPQRAGAELLRAQVTTRSWLGSVIHRTGGLVLDHGWLRVLGSGSEQHALASLGEINERISAGLIVAQDVLGGQFAWTPGASGKPTIQYLASARYAAVGGHRTRLWRLARCHDRWCADRLLRGPALAGMGGRSRSLSPRPGHQRISSAVGPGRQGLQLGISPAIPMSEAMSLIGVADAT